MPCVNSSKVGNSARAMLLRRSGNKRKDACHPFIRRQWKAIALGTGTSSCIRPRHQGTAHIHCSNTSSLMGDVRCHVVMPTTFYKSPIDSAFPRPASTTGPRPPGSCCGQHPACLPIYAPSRRFGNIAAPLAAQHVVRALHTPKAVHGLGVVVRPQEALRASRVHGAADDEQQQAVEHGAGSPEAAHVKVHAVVVLRLEGGRSRRRRQCGSTC